MQFNTHATNQDLYSDSRWWCGLANDDTTSFTLAEFTRGANFALDRITSLIFKADNKWEWDDSNQTDLPIATTNLVSGQADYGIPVTHLKIHRVRIKDSAGNLIILTPANRRDLTDAELTEGNGTPRKYDKLGNSIFPYPKTNYASTGGLEVQFQRGASLFITTDTTKTPGFAAHLHRLISLYPARDYCLVNELNSRLVNINAEIAKLELDLIDHYSQRNFDEKQSLALQKEDYGELGLVDTGGKFINHPDKFF